MNKKPLILYHYWRSSCSWRLRWAFEIKEIKYELKHINLLDSEHKSESYLKKNPSAQVPCLQIGSNFYSESLAILEWLEDSYPQPNLLPKDPQKRILVRQLTNMIASGIQPLQNLKVQKYFAKQKDKQQAYALYWIKNGLDAIEKILQQHAGEYCCGTYLSFADLCLIPQIYNGLRFSLNLSDYPIISKIYLRCLDLASCKASSPENYRP